MIIVCPNALPTTRTRATRTCHAQCIDAPVFKTCVSHGALQINEKQLKKTLGFIEKGKQQGARLVTGGCHTAAGQL